MDVVDIVVKGASECSGEMPSLHMRLVDALVFAENVFDEATYVSTSDFSANKPAAASFSSVSFMSSQL